MDLVLRRCHLASLDLYKQAMKRPKELKVGLLTNLTGCSDCGVNSTRVVSGH